MRFLADENVPVPSLRRLRERGLDLVSVLEADPGLGDPDVIRLAKSQDRVLITFDSDIGERIYKHRDAPPLGVIYLRFIQSDAEESARVILDIVDALGSGLEGAFVTYRNARVRRQPLPEPLA